MSGLDNLKTRLNYMGGGKQQGRMNEDKLRTLKKALIYSYQAATAIMPDGREFRCLMNRNKMTMDLDNKIISMPYKDISFLIYLYLQFVYHDTKLLFNSLCKIFIRNMPFFFAAFFCRKRIIIYVSIYFFSM